MDVGTQSDNDTEFHSPQFDCGSLNQIAQSLDCTLIKSPVPKRDALSYGKRKVKQIKSAVKTKFACAFDLQREDLDSPLEEDTEDSCEDLDRLMILLKEKLKVSTGEDKASNPGARSLDTPKNCPNVQCN